MHRPVISSQTVAQTLNGNSLIESAMHNPVDKDVRYSRTFYVLRHGLQKPIFYTMFMKIRDIYYTSSQRRVEKAAGMSNAP